MRKIIIALLVLFSTGTAQASGGLSCEGKSKGVSFAFGGGVTRGMGGGLFAFEGSARVTAQGIAKDLRRVKFGKEHVAQFALDRKRLALVLYRERSGNKPHGYAELSVETRPADDEGTYEGKYRLTVFDMTGAKSGNRKTFTSEGKVTCFAE